MSLRPATAEDEAFLLQVAAATRPELPPELQVMQARAQESDYRARFPDLQRWVVHRGADVGRLYLLERPEELRVVDIALLPSARGQGLGTAVLEQVLATPRPVTLHVAHGNPALRLYARLGFVVTGQDEVYAVMERQLKTASSTGRPS